MTDEEEKLLRSWSRGLEPDVDLRLVRVAVASALDEVRRLRGDAPPRVEVERIGEAEAADLPADPYVAYWRGRAQALEDEVRRLVDLIRLLARDPD